MLNKNIIINIDKEITLLNKNELSLPGNHNLENCMAAAAIAYVCNINIDTIREVLKTFAGVAHRQEFVRNLNGIMFVNDSKATNPDSSIKAVQSYNKPIVLIAGGIGNSLNIENAITIGLLPDVDRSKFQYIGNSSLVGSYLALISKDAKNKLEEIGKEMTYVELSVYPGYMDEFISACFIPQTNIEEFPSIKNMIKC